MRAAAAAALLAAIAPASLARAKPPARGEVARLLLAPTRPAVACRRGKSVDAAKIFDLGEERFAVVYTVRERPDENMFEDTPCVALLTREGEKVAVAGTVALPTAQSPRAGSTHMAPNEDLITWGTWQVKDFDLDGKPELMVIYAYDNSMGQHAREWALVELDAPPAIALHLTLEEQRGNERIGATITQTWKLTAAPPELNVKRVEEPHGDWPPKDPIETALRWRYDAAARKWSPVEK